MSKYDVVYYFTKKGNLTQYMCTDRVSNGIYGGVISEAARADYAKERDISLIAMFRYESEKANGRRITHCLCKIKCPINPLPVKGEFEAPGASEVVEYLINNGWTIKQKIYPRMFE